MILRLVSWCFQRHRLPTFPPDAARIFRQLCGELEVEYLDEIREKLAKSVEDLKAQVDRNKFPRHLETIEALAERSYYLLEVYPTLPLSRRALVIGAVRYFAVSDDALVDTRFASGFHDDARVMNHVLEQLKIHDRYIKL